MRNGRQFRQQNVRFRCQNIPVKIPVMPLLLVNPAECWNLLETVYQLVQTVLGVLCTWSSMHSNVEEEYHLDHFPFFLMTLMDEQEFDEGDYGWEEQDEDWETTGSSVDWDLEEEDLEEEEPMRKNAEMYSFDYHRMGDNCVAEPLLVDNQINLERKEEYILKNLLNLQRQTWMNPRGCNYRSLVRTELYNRRFGL
ncbi:unnamed protein product [Phyllotreta striolata]|uniref:Uncharacterized protein n=1 Tax=Phyllotreta striolata TaxID=444603 RepID=A0A9P0DK47_PHYSR|nr:unnamed protein product [Phyllotreta striolata]